MKKIVVIGSANFDFTQTGTTFPEQGQTALASNSYTSIGGKGANQAVSASRLTPKSHVHFIGVIGNDFMGNAIIDVLKTENLDISSLRRVNGISTGNALIYIDSDNQNHISVDLGANSLCSTEEIFCFSKMASEVSVVVLQQEVPIETNYKILKEAKAKNVVTILDPGPPSNDVNQYPDYFQLVDFLTPNLYEAEAILNHTIKKGSEIDAAKEIRKLGPKNVIVTLGDKGIATAGEISGLFPSPKVKSIDPVGSGDCFNGSLAVKISEKCELSDALHISQLTAAISTTKFGAIKSFPSISDLKNYEFNQ